MYPLVYLRAIDPKALKYSNELKITEWEPKLDSLRHDEYESATFKIDNNTEFIAAYCTKSYTRIESIINISRTTFIVIVLGIASYVFTKDATEIVLDPLERMIEKVKYIAKNPLIAASEEINEIGIFTVLEKHNQKKSKRANDKIDDDDDALLV